MNDDLRLGAILAALADPTRRAVLERLRGGPLPVTDIARPVPVSRPAVSQHLGVLLAAGLVEMRSRGTRHIYALAPDGAAPLSDWLVTLRPVAAKPDAGLRRDLVTRLGRAESWRLFCDIAAWWPAERLSLSALAAGAVPRGVTLDATPGGRLGEVLFDGTGGEWARVTEARPGALLAFDWRLGLAAEAPVILAFLDAEDGSRLVLSSPDDSAAAQEMWDAVLPCFAAAAKSAPPDA